MDFANMKAKRVRSGGLSVCVVVDDGEADDDDDARWAC